MTQPIHDALSASMPSASRLCGQDYKFACHCCGNLTFSEDPTDTFDICPVCFWEHEYGDNMGGMGPNGISLSEAKANYLSFGACSEEVIQHTRKPYPSELPTAHTAARAKGTEADNV